jgi:hypothetical protein
MMSLYYNIIQGAVMAKYEKKFTGDFNDLVACLHDNIMRGSASVSYEDGSNYMVGDTRLAVRVYERYSMAGGNRVSLSVSIIASGNDIFLSAITSGGSQAVFFKINTLGEETFLDLCIKAVENYISNQ